MESFDVIIVGAGASGLAAARELTGSGKNVLVIEANSRAGGRILTFRPPGFTIPIEAGAEFIHGEAPVTEMLLKEAAIPKTEMSGYTYRFENNKLTKSDEFVQGMPLLLEKMKSLKQDIPLKQFMEKNFPGDRYTQLNKSLKRLVEGYDAADMNVVSTFSIRDELSGGGIENTFRPQKGYGGLVDFLYKEIEKYKGRIVLSAIVQKIEWEKGRVRVLCSNGNAFAAEKVLIALSPAVLLNQAIEFSPGISNVLNLFSQIGFGTVIKIIMEFSEQFWEKENFLQENMPGLDFLLTDTIPVTAWWTQLPEKVPVLTAWMAGPNANKIKGYNDEALFEIVLSVLARICRVHENVIRSLLKAKYIANWSADKNFLGAYSFSTIYSSGARKKISQTIDNTIFFTGEALYEGETAGTVEAALANGIETAKKMTI